MEDTIRETKNESDYRFSKDSTKYYISNFQAALGLTLFNTKFKKHMEKREENAKLLGEEINNIEGITPITRVPGATKIHYIRYPVLINKKKRSCIINRLRQKGIETSPMYVVHGMKVNPKKFPGAAKVADEILTLPCHPKITEEDVLTISRVMKNSLKE